MLGYRYDTGRDAYVLRLIGNRLGPVLRNAPHDSAAEAMEWPEEQRRQAARRRTGRFTRDAKQETKQETLRR
jgi:hypothetical protein